MIYNEPHGREEGYRRRGQKSRVREDKHARESVLREAGGGGWGVGEGGYVSEWFGKVSSLMKPHGFSPNKFLLYAWGF